ncbi:MAG: hypothetical protein JWN11_526 [Hyphomicrobiales bacterium]|nr:hypothetical protein [Hyphomicrobiales bacterium]
MKTVLQFAAVALLVAAVSGQALAGDLNVGSCQFASQSTLPQLPSQTVKLTVHQYYDAASAELKNSAVIDSAGPAFVWASETKFACGKALGYLRSGTVDKESVQKCDCSYNRLTTLR